MLMLGSGCLSSPPGAAPGEGDAGPGSDGGPPVACGTFESLSETFDEGISEWRWEIDGTVQPEDGRARLMAAPDLSSWLVRQAAADLDGADLVVHLDLAPMQPDSRFAVELYDGTSYLSLERVADVLQVRVDEAGFEGVRAATTFDEEMRWWRVGRHDGQFQWATSANGATWEEHEPFPAELDGQVELVFVLEGGPNGSEALVEGVNPEGGAFPCPADSFVDDFAALAPHWRTISPEICSVVADGELLLDLTGPDACGLESRQRFSLLESSITIELLEPGEGLLRPSFEIGFASGSAAFTVTGEGDEEPLTLYAHRDGDDLGTGRWDATDNRVLRMRHSEDAGGVVFETAPLGGEFVRMGLATDIPESELEEVEVRLLIFSEEPPGRPISFDQLNL
jgi:hypothetical protein